MAPIGLIVAAPLLLAASLSIVGPRRELPCDGSFASDPVSLGFEDGGVGAPRRACTRTEVSLGTGGIAIVETSEFYGNIRLLGTLGASYAVDRSMEIFGAIELLHYQTVISSFSATHLGVGHTSLGLTNRLIEGDASLLSGTVRLALPTAIGLYENAWPFGLDAGASALTAIAPGLELHGYLGLRASVAATRGASQPRAGAVLDAGVAWRPLEWLALVVDLEGAALYRDALDHVAAGLAIRALPDEGLGVELALKAPLAGDERALAAAWLGVSYVFGG